MERNRIDELAVAVSEGQSRRGLLKGALGGGLGALLAVLGFTQEAEAFRLRRCIRRCRREFEGARQRRCIRRCRRRERNRD